MLSVPRVTSSDEQFKTAVAQQMPLAMGSRKCDTNAQTSTGSILIWDAQRMSTCASPPRAETLKGSSCPPECLSAKRVQSAGAYFSVSARLILHPLRPVNREGHIRAKVKLSNHTKKSDSLFRLHIALWLKRV